MSTPAILLTLAGIITLTLVALAFWIWLAERDEQQLRDDLSDSDRGVDFCGWVEVGPDFYTMPDGTVHPSAGSSPGDSRGAALSRNGGAPVSDLLHDNGNSPEEQRNRV
jgi:hypothetical protein